MIGFLMRHTDALYYAAMPLLAVGIVGPVLGRPRRLCMQLHVAAWAVALAGSLLDLAAAVESGVRTGGAIVWVGIVVFNLILEVRRYLRHKDDDDDRKPPRRRSLRWRLDLSGLVLPGVVPARGAA